MAAFRERDDRQDPRPGRQGPGDLRPVGRRRFRGRRRADPRGDRRPAHLRLRRPRPAARRTRPSRSSTLFRDHYNIPLVHVDAAQAFLGALAGVTDPEAKRKTIGGLFIDVFEEEAKKIGGAEFLAQGTLYPDVIESVSFTGGPSVDDQDPPQCRRPARAHEPEAGRAAARAVQGRGARARPRARPARALRRPPSVPRPGPRHPHPRRDHARRSSTILRKADAIYLDEIRKAGLYDEIWQAFAVLLPVRTVGVMGDAPHLRPRLRPARRHLDRRHDGRLLSIPARPSSAASRPASSTRCKGINRVVYDVTSKPPGTIEWE